MVKLEEGSKTEHLQAQRCRARLDHLESADVENLSEWNNMRLNRILVDYMLRMSYFDTAVKMAESQNIQVPLLSCVRLVAITYFLFTASSMLVFPVGLYIIDYYDWMYYSACMLLGDHVFCICQTQQNPSSS